MSSGLEVQALTGDLPLSERVYWVHDQHDGLGYSDTGHVPEDARRVEWDEWAAIMRERGGDPSEHRGG